MSIDWFTFFAQIANFVVLIALLNHFLYRPISEAIKNREEKIANKIRTAEQETAEAMALKREYEDLHKQIESTRQLMLDQVTNEVDDFRKKLMQDARNDVQFRREDWLDSLRREKDSLVRTITEKSAEQALAMSTRALAQLADGKLEAQTLERFLHYLASLTPLELEQLKKEVNESPNPGLVESAFPISNPWQVKIEKSLEDQFGLERVEFAVDKEMIMGVNLKIGGLRIGFHVREFMDSLADEIQRELTR